MNAPANLLELQLVYPFDQTLPPPGGRFEVAPGIYWLRMPLPFALDHINLWLIRDRFEGRDGWTLIDCGASTPAAIDLWEQIITHHLDGLPIVRVLCTHTHPDHIGLAGALCKRFGAPLWMSQGEFAMGHTWSQQDEEYGRQSAAHFRRHGLVDPRVLEGVRAARPFTSLVPFIPRSFRRIVDGEIVTIGPGAGDTSGRDATRGRVVPGAPADSWRAIFGYGHSPEHVALYNAERGILLSGDMVLPRISSNVSVFEMEPDADPVRWYMDSLKRYDDCADTTLVLPSHGRPFRNLHTRIGQLLDHHEDRLALVLEACAAKPMHATETVPVMFQREFDAQQTTFAIGESLAHLHALWYRGLVRRETGDDGIVRFSAC